MPANADTAPVSVCLATTTGGYDHARVLDSVLARALAPRGAEVDLLLCDAALPACQMTKSGRIAPADLASRAVIPYCERCVALGVEAFEPLGRPIRRVSDYIDARQAQDAARTARTLPLTEIRAFEVDGLPVGDHAFAGALRYFARGDLAGEEHGEGVLRSYFEAGLRTIAAIRRLLETHHYDVIVIHHGIYIPQGMIVEVARALGVRVVTYNPAYRKHCFTFSHGKSYHFTMLDEPREHWVGVNMTPQLRRETDAYLQSRRAGSNDWIWFHDEPREDVRGVLREIGCDPDRPYVAALTSVVWDAQLHYKANAFENMLDWLRKTIEYWARRHDLQLVIRVHPAEIRGGVVSRQKVVDEIAGMFPVLPPNVFVLPPENQASTYALIETSDAVIIYNTKTGAEIGYMGVPIIVAGEAWVRGKGFSEDVVDEPHYYRLLDALPYDRPMEPSKHRLAEKYAYHFFFRRMIPLPFISQDTSATFQVSTGAEDLRPGRWPGLDTICDGILHGTPFTYPAETLDDPFQGEVHDDVHR